MGLQVLKSSICSQAVAGVFLLGGIGGVWGDYLTHEQLQLLSNKSVPDLSFHRNHMNKNLEKHQIKTVRALSPKLSGAL